MKKLSILVWLLFLSAGPVYASGGLLDNIIGDAGAPDDEPLPVEEAFKFSHEPPGEDGVKLSWKIAPDHYLYRHALKFLFAGNSHIKTGPVDIPPGEPKEDPLFGTTNIFHDRLDVFVPFERLDNRAVDTELTVKYQGCAERGICYPPQTVKVRVKLGGEIAAKETGVFVPGQDKQDETEAFVSEQDEIASSLEKGNFIGNIIWFFLAGLGLAFTPCVFPMLPILSSIIVGHGESITTRKAFVLSLTYVLAMAVVFSLAGVAAGFAGGSIQVAMQQPWVLVSFALIFVALALSMFGFYEIQMPSAIQGKLSRVSNRQRQGSLLGATIMGGLSALIVGACVTPVLIGAIIFIGKTGDAFLGGASLFALGIGMGIPLVAVGTAGGRYLPKQGGWMNVVKAVFGVMLLGLALWIVHPVLGMEYTTLLAAILIIVSGVYMGAFSNVDDKSPWFMLWKSLGLVMVIYGVMLFISFAGGYYSFMSPLKGLGGGAPVQTQSHFTRLKSYADLELALAKTDKSVMLDFYADWCVACKELEAYTFSVPKVQAKLKNMLVLQADVTANDKTDKELMKKLKVIGPPAILFFDKNGVEKKNFRLYGFSDADKFAAHLDRLL